MHAWHEESGGSGGFTSDRSAGAETESREDWDRRGGGSADYHAVDDLEGRLPGVGRDIGEDDFSGVHIWN